MEKVLIFVMGLSMVLRSAAAFKHGTEDTFWYGSGLVVGISLMFMLIAEGVWKEKKKRWPGNKKKTAVPANRCGIILVGSQIANGFITKL